MIDHYSLIIDRDDDDDDVDDEDDDDELSVELRGTPSGGHALCRRGVLN